MPELSVEAIGALGESELASLVRELLNAEGKSPTVPAGGDLLYADAEGRTLIEMNRSGITPLAGVSLASIAQRAAELNASRAELYLTGVVDADRQAGFDRVFDQLRRGTGVSVRLIDAQGLLVRLQPYPDLARKYFPSEADAEAVAVNRDIPVGLVKFASAVAPKPRPLQPVREYLRLAWTASAVVILVWLPIRVSPVNARWIGGVGIVLIALAVGLAQLIKPERGVRSFRAGSVMDSVIPVKDELAVRREITTGEGRGAGRFLLGTLEQIPAAVVRLGTQTALLLFLVTSSLSYMLVWGLSAIKCDHYSHVCQSAIGGLGGSARIGEFMTIAVNSAFFVTSAPSHSSGLAQGLIAAEFVVSAVLLASYAAFFGFTILGRARPD